MEHLYCIDGAVKSIINSRTGIMKNSVNTKKLLKKLLGVKTVFADILTEDIKKVKKEFNAEELVSYSSDVMIIPKQVSLKDKKHLMILKALELLTIKSFKIENKVIVKSGFEFIECEYTSEGSLASIIYKNSYLNYIALSIYSRFIQSKNIYPNVTIDTFMRAEVSKKLVLEELLFIKASNCLGNDVFFDAFKSGDYEKIDLMLKHRGTSFEEFGARFERGIDPEYIRNITQPKSDVSENVRLLNGEVFEEILLHLYDEFKISESQKDIKQYFVNSYYYNLFGEKVEITSEIEKIKKFYGPINLLYFVEVIDWNRKYKELRTCSLDKAIQHLKHESVVVESRKILEDTEKLNRLLEKGNEEMQNLFFKDIKEIFMNCMFAMSGDKTVLSKDFGRIYTLVLVAQKVRGIV